MSEMPVFNRPFESNSSSEPPNSKPAKTVRLNIDLNQVNPKGEVVLNYTKLLNEEKARRARGDHSGKSARDSKRLKLSDNRYQSYAELGAGYDDDDSFIDNTDAYEEGLPEDMDTKLGGYYINSGELELKSRRDSSKSSGSDSDSSETETSSDDDEPKKEPVKKDHDSSDSKKPSSDSDGKKKAKVIHVPMKDSKHNNNIVFSTSSCLPSFKD